jgi:hypothetical protein
MVLSGMILLSEASQERVITLNTSFKNGPVRLNRLKKWSCWKQQLKRMVLPRKWSKIMILFLETMFLGGDQFGTPYTSVQPGMFMT